MLSISFSLLLLTLIDVDSGARFILTGTSGFHEGIITRDRVSLAFFLPAYYRDKISKRAGRCGCGADDLFRKRLQR